MNERGMVLGGPEMGRCPPLVSDLNVQENITVQWPLRWLEFQHFGSDLLSWTFERGETVYARMHHVDITGEASRCAPPWGAGNTATGLSSETVVAVTAVSVVVVPTDVLTVVLTVVVPADVA